VAVYHGWVSVTFVYCVQTAKDIRPDGNQQKLSYRKQTARELRIQYAEGINSNPVTLNL